MVFQVEEVLDVLPGSLSRLCGYLPLHPVAAALSVEDVISNSNLVDGDCKNAMLMVWREFVRRQDAVPKHAGAAARTVPPRARRKPGRALVEHKRHYQWELKDRGRAESTIRNSLAAVEEFYRYMCRNGRPGTDVAVRTIDVESFLEEVRMKRSPKTATDRRSALRHFFQWLVDEGELRQSPMAAVTRGD